MVIFGRGSQKHKRLSGSTYGMTKNVSDSDNLWNQRNTAQQTKVYVIWDH
jgi:hypothetical protein